MEHLQFAVRVACTVGEFQGCFCKTPTPPASAPRWTPPPRDMLKFNVDGGFVEDGMQGAWGVVVRVIHVRWWQHRLGNLIMLRMHSTLS